MRSRIVDHRVPKAIPAEIQALINAHLSGLPVAVISSQEFPLRLPSEYGCNFLGFFFLTDINVSMNFRIPPLSFMLTNCRGKRMNRLCQKLTSRIEHKGASDGNCASIGHLVEKISCLAVKNLLHLGG